jgi:aspartyl-tRNA(Asn)/glutamyl-tRNA(Gln) amidotransferase subunit C
MITRQDVEYVARLARLRLSEQEIGTFTRQLDGVIEYVRQLDKADTAGVTPTAFVIPEHDPARDDVVQPSLPREDALRNGPSVRNGFFAIPKVIG